MIGGRAPIHQMTNSHILIQDFTYVEPASLDDALAALHEYGEEAAVMAGGTYLLVQMKMERQWPAYLINLGKLRELKALQGRDQGWQVGALTAIREIRDAAWIQMHYTALAEACAAFGSTQIQKMGTIGGNLCNGSPASDTVPALLAFDARLALLGQAGQRVLPVEDFLKGPGQTALQQGEVLTSIHLPRQRPGTGSAFIKLSRVKADLAKVSAAAVLVREGERVVGCRLALGSVAPTVMRARRAEELLIEQAFSPRLALEAGILASKEISPIDDVRSTAWYRREVVRAVIHDALCRAWERARGDGARGGVGAWPADSTSAADDSARSVPKGSAIRASLHVGPVEKHPIELTVNGQVHRLPVAPNELLLNVLRDRLELTGTKYGCGIGECGACTVHLNGEPTLACLTLAISADGSEILTVEGLQGADGTLDPLQDAFIDHQAFQCGYCTPGMLLVSKSLLNEVPSPTEDDVRDYLRGNRCRCTGFASITRAVLSQVGGEVKEGRED